ncbi:MAG TPA: PilZ domain-containing protein [Syntrophorhabdaceae bacterium]|nr:PilZ domain-containing protein [Syntrophorhabdaceae bacterium]
MKKDVTICFRTSEDLRGSLEKIADSERRSLSSIIETVLYNHLKDRHVLKGLKNERRGYPRKEVSLPAFVYQRESKESSLQTGIIIDLSLGGMRISVPEDYEAKDAGEFDTIFTIPNEKTPIKMKCAVKRVFGGPENTKDLAANFVDGDFSGYQKLHKYLTQ